MCCSELSSISDVSSEARRISIKSDDADQQALSFYLLSYLQFLSNAGHHIIFSLPDFDDDDLQIDLDFSSASKAGITVEEISEVSIEKINTYLTAAFFKAAMFQKDAEQKGVTDVKGSLSEIRSSSADFHCHVKFGAPRIKALCDQEVIVHFVIEELLVYDGADFSA